MYSRGEGVKQDCDLAAYWIGLAAEQGYPAAIRNLYKGFPVFGKILEYIVA